MLNHLHLISLLSDLRKEKKERKGRKKEKEEKKKKKNTSEKELQSAEPPRDYIARVTVAIHLEMYRSLS